MTKVTRCVPCQHNYHSQCRHKTFLCRCAEGACKERIAHFDGETYVPEFDYDRLGRQWQVVYDVMQDGEWRTLAEIEEVVSFPPQSISARLRDFRKVKFGAHTVERRHRGDPHNGLYEYRLLVRPRRVRKVPRRVR